MKKNTLYILFSLCTLMLGCQLKNDKVAKQEKLVMPTHWNFERIVVDSAFTRGYQVTVADFNNDQKPDLAAVSDREQAILWYENPTWEKHTINNTTPNNIDLAPHDVNGDGHIDLVLACRFALGKSIEGGYIYWLENPGSADKMWEKYYIDSIPTAHRIRWADIDGDGTEELINLPIIGIGAVAPEYDIPLDMVHYAIPEDPKADSWPKTIIDSSLHMAHGISIEQFDNDNQLDILTASFEGVMLFTSGGEERNRAWEKRQVGSGDTNPRPQQGASEVGLGTLAPNQPFIATIEPWHGHQVVVYTPNAQENELWTRTVIDTTFVDGHALRCADLDNDGIAEIIAGHRGEGYHLYIYQYNAQRNEWFRYTLDKGGMSAAGLFIFDFNADGYPDIAACGSRTNNVVLYRNLLSESPNR